MLNNDKERTLGPTVAACLEMPHDKVCLKSLRKEKLKTHDWTWVALKPIYALAWTVHVSHRSH